MCMCLCMRMCTCMCVREHCESTVEARAGQRACACAPCTYAHVRHAHVRVHSTWVRACAYAQHVRTHSMYVCTACAPEPMCAWAHTCTCACACPHAHVRRHACMHTPCECACACARDTRSRAVARRRLPRACAVHNIYMHMCMPARGQSHEELGRGYHVHVLCMIYICICAYPLAGSRTKSSAAARSRGFAEEMGDAGEK